MINSVR